MSTYAVVVWIHIVAAAVWVGSMVFFAAVIVPVLRRSDTAAGLLRQIGARFRILGLASLALLVVTGLLNLGVRGVGASTLLEPAFWSTGFGRVLGWKLGLVVLVIVMTLTHDLALTERATRALEQTPRSSYALRKRRLASWLGRAVMLLSLAILYIAVVLVRGLG